MKLSDFDTKSPQDEGAFMHLHHTKYGFPVYTGPNADNLGRWIGKEAPDPAFAVGMIVRGMEAQSVQEFTRRQKRLMMSAKSKVPTGFEEDTDHENGIKFGCVLIVSFVNIEDDNGNTLDSTEENKRAFISLSDNISKQLLTFAQDQSNFFEALPSA
jgi:hypothetical protein